MDDRSTRVDRVERGPPDHDQSMCWIKGIITAEIQSCGTHLDRQIKIQRAWFKAFYKRISNDHIWTVHHDRTAMIFLKWSTMDRSIVTVDRNDRTVTKWRPIKRLVLHNCKAFKLDFNQIDLSRHQSSHFSWVLPLPLSFPRPRRGRSQELVENWGRNRRLKLVVTFLVFLAINRFNRDISIAKRV